MTEIEREHYERVRPIVQRLALAMHGGSFANEFARQMFEGYAVKVLTECTAQDVAAWHDWLKLDFAPEQPVTG